MRPQLNREYGMSVPIIGSGENFHGSPVLAAAASEAGGMGILGATKAQPKVLRRWIAEAARLTRQPFAVELDATCCGERHVEECAGAGVAVVVFCWDLPPAAWIDWLHESGVRVWFRTMDRELAMEAVATGCDAVIAHGVDLTPYGGDDSTLETIGEIVDAIAPTLVFGAGNIANGPDVEASLALGAAAVCIEAPLPILKKSALMA
jgi:enoyl-[acyl-carrier protein] reductase II